MHKETRLPAAILAYTRQAPVQTLLYPFSEYSPEYQAILWAHENKVPCRFTRWICHRMYFLHFRKPIGEKRIPDEEGTLQKRQGRTTEQVYADLEMLLGESHETFWERHFEQITGDYAQAAGCLWQ